MVDFILLLLAAICFLLAAAGGTLVNARTNLVALGLFFWVLVALISAFPK